MSAAADLGALLPTAPTGTVWRVSLGNRRRDALGLRLELSLALLDSTVTPNAPILTEVVEVAAGHNVAEAVQLLAEAAAGILRDRPLPAPSAPGAPLPDRQTVDLSGIPGDYAGSPR